MREIIDFSISNFQNVDPLYKPIVKNSMLNGVFSPYYAINPMLQKARGDGEDYSIIDDPLENYNKVFNGTDLKYSIDSCIVGPIDKTIPKLEEDNYKIINENIDKYDIINHKLKILQEDVNDEEDEDDEKANVYIEEEQEEEYSDEDM